MADLRALVRERPRLLALTASVGFAVAALVARIAGAPGVAVPLRALAVAAFAVWAALFVRPHLPF